MKIILLFFFKGSWGIRRRIFVAEGFSGSWPGYLNPAAVGFPIFWAIGFNYFVLTRIKMYAYG